MDAGRLEWCAKQKKGIKLIEPNDNLALEYLKEAEETMLTLKEIKKSNMWLATTKYYCEYFAVYALLMKIGIKSEIYECTIAVAETLEDNKILPKGTTKMLKKDKELRIDNQYYLKNKAVRVDLNQIRDFILNVKNEVLKMTVEKKNNIRKVISNYINQK